MVVVALTLGLILSLGFAAWAGWRLRCCRLAVEGARRTAFELTETRAALVAAESERRARETLVTGLTTDFRRGLEAIAGFAAVLRDSSSGTAVRRRMEALDQIQDLASRLDDMAARLSGEASDRPRRLDARLFLREVCETLSSATARIFEPPARPDVLASAPPCVRVAPETLRSLLTDLLTQAARQIGPNGTVRTSVTSCEREVRLTVHHPGGVLERRGAALDSLDLQVRSMRGRLESDAGLGKTSVVLPLAEAGCRSQVLPEDAVLLCVEPRAANRALLRALLGGFGAAQVHAVETLDEGARMARDLAPDLILADAANVADALAFRDVLYEDGLTRAIPVIGMGSAGETDETPSHADAFDAWLPRPISAGALAAVVERALVRTSNLSRGEPRAA